MGAGVRAAVLSTRRHLPDKNRQGSGPDPGTDPLEPFEGLDLRQSRDVAQTLRTHAAAGRTMFLSIHQIGDAARVCDRFVLLSGGRVCGEGTLPELSALAAARSGSPATDDLEEVFLALT